jgi:hypothetical protein
LNLEAAEKQIRTLTRRRSTKDALAWLAEDRAIAQPIELPQLLRTLFTIEDEATDGEIRALAARAGRHLCRTKIHSELDPSQELLGLDEVLRPAQYRAALDALAARTAGRSLANVTLSAVIAAQKDDPNVLVSLCAAAGLARRDLRARVQKGVAVPSNLRGTWKNESVKATFEVIDAVITGKVTASIPVAHPARPVEHLLPDLDLPADDTTRARGWALVEEMRSKGVPFEVLLTQRAVGGAWVAHRNSTGFILQAEIATTLSELLTDRKVPHDRLRLDAASRSLLARAGANPAAADAGGSDEKQEGGQLAVLVHTPQVKHAIAISVARDGGTARKSAGRLTTLPARLGLPCTLVLVGPGWAQRNETTELARPFEGRIYTEQTLADLANSLRGMVEAGLVVPPVDNGAVAPSVPAGA